LEEKAAAPVYTAENTALGIRHAHHVAPSIRSVCYSLILNSNIDLDNSNRRNIITSHVQNQKRIDSGNVFSQLKYAY
jgi:hypothetical protein